MGKPKRFDSIKNNSINPCLGRLYLRHTQKRGFHLKCLTIYPAPHENKSETIVLGESDIKTFSISREGDLLEFYRHVGGGGGHYLYIDNLQMIVRYHSHAEEERRKTKLVEMDKLISEHLSFISNPEFEFVASSEWDFINRTHQAKYSLLDSVQNHGSSAWCSAVNDENQWLQVDMQIPYRMESIAIQDRGDCDQYIKSYRIGVSDDGKEFSMLNSGELFYKHPTDYVTFHDMGQVVCRYVRLFPVTWHCHISVRWGLAGEKATLKEMTQTNK